MRHFHNGDRVQIKPHVRIGKQLIGCRICTVLAVHKGIGKTGLSLADGGNVHYEVLASDVRFLEHAEAGT